MPTAFAVGSRTGWRPAAALQSILKGIGGARTLEIPIARNAQVRCFANPELADLIGLQLPPPCSARISSVR
jgi:hypothetical protein